MKFESKGPVVPAGFPKPSADRPLILLSRQVPELMLEYRVLHWKRKRPMLFYLAGAPHTFYVCFPISTGKPSRRASPAHAGLFHSFTGERSRGVSAFKIMVPGAKVHELGKLSAIEYQSPKEFLHSRGKKSHAAQMYVHEVSRPHPTVYATPCMQTIIIHGGIMRIWKDAEGISWLDD
jgi:hypothetical protein